MTRPADAKETVDGYFSSAHFLGIGIGLGPSVEPCRDSLKFKRNASVISVRHFQIRSTPVGVHVCVGQLMMIALFTFNSSLVLLIDGLCSSNSWEFEFSGFRRQYSVPAWPSGF